MKVFKTNQPKSQSVPVKFWNPFGKYLNITGLLLRTFIYIYLDINTPVWILLRNAFISGLPVDLH